MKNPPNTSCVETEYFRDHHAHPVPAVSVASLVCRAYTYDFPLTVYARHLGSDDGHRLT